MPEEDGSENGSGWLKENDNLPHRPIHFPVLPSEGTLLVGKALAVSISPKTFDGGTGSAVPRWSFPPSRRLQAEHSDGCRIPPETPQPGALGPGSEFWPHHLLVVVA